MLEETPPAAPGVRNSNGRRQRLLLQLGAAFLAAGLVYAGYWWFIGQYHESTDDAYVAGNVVSVTPQIAGTVTAIEADETDLVRQGQVLVRLDATDTAIALDAAKANLADTVRQVRQMYERLKELRATVLLREADVARAREDLSRREALVVQHAVSNEELQHARTAFNTAQAALSAAQHQLAAAAVLVSGTDVAHHPLVRAAEARLREAYLAWRRHAVLSPVSGYVAQRRVQLGSRVAPGTPLMTIVPLDQLWVEANFKENQFSDIRLGQPVTMTADLYGRAVVFHGKVLGVGAGTGAAFALLPPQNASGNWIKIVQRVPVRISLDPKELQERPLRIGLSMQVAIDTHDRSGEVLARTPVSGARYQTAVYEESSAAIEQMIAAIVRANDVARGASAR
jgi:membrane fusion protein (multidrug efflux system)